MYFRSVLRSTPRLSAISFFDRPACQCTSISVTSITPNVLLAISLPSSQTGGRLLLLDGQIHHDTHAIPMENYVIGVGNYVIATPSKLGNYMSADRHATGRYDRPDQAQAGRPRPDQRVPENSLTTTENTSSEPFREFCHGTGIGIRATRSGPG